MPPRTHSADVVIAGGGLAGLVTALSLLDRGKSVLVVDKDSRERLGGLARESFGGVHFIGTPHQRRMGIRDTPDLAYEDWERCARFGPDDDWPRRWARHYCDHSLDAFRFLVDRKVAFLPLVNWPERGAAVPGNRVPRWHIAWGTGFEIVRRVVDALEAHPRRAALTLLCDHEVNAIAVEGGRPRAFTGKEMAGGAEFAARGEQLVVASGGICGGDLSRVRSHWRGDLGPPPRVLLNGAHRYGDGLLHDRVAGIGGRLTHLDLHWHYAAGIHHPARRRPDDGLSLVPPRSALWMNADGARIGPTPLVGYTDTGFLVEQILKQPGQYSWQVMNWKIAIKELAVSGCDYMTAFRHKRRLLLLRHLLLGNAELVRRLIAECPDDVVAADSLPELVRAMNQRGLDGHLVDGARLEADVRAYDDEIARGEAYFTDEQLRRIMGFRQSRGDRLRVCRYQPILDPGARPLIAIREFILARKSLGGIQTDLGCRVLDQQGQPIPGLHAVGEAAGFGGGGIHGRGALEGTFLGGCVITGLRAGRSIAEA